MKNENSPLVVSKKTEKSPTAPWVDFCSEFDTLIC